MTALVVKTLQKRVAAISALHRAILDGGTYYCWTCTSCWPCTTHQLLLGLLAWIDSVEPDDIEDPAVAAEGEGV